MYERTRNLASSEKADGPRRIRVELCEAERLPSITVDTDRDDA